MTTRLQPLAQLLRGIASQIAGQDEDEEGSQPAPTGYNRSFRTLLLEHFGADPIGLPLLSDEYASTDHINVQLSLDAWLHEKGRSHRAVGVQSPPYAAADFEELALEPDPQRGSPRQGPVKHIRCELPGGTVISAIDSALLLIRDESGPSALLMVGPRGHDPKVRVSAMAPTEAAAQAILATLRKGLRAHNAYRGRVLSLVQENYMTVWVQYHTLPEVTRESVILPGNLLDQIERHAVAPSKHREKLLAMKRHIKRGLLLYGPPGTGKTYTAMYLAKRMPERTTIVMTGRAIGLLERCCDLARLLQPSTVIVEDVDLIAEERESQKGCQVPLLFELLNQMDGVGEDADVLFVLTTNRPEVLEPALAARPGRVDHAMEVPLPDADCRRRLIALYAEGMSLELSDLEAPIRRTEGVSAAFVKELLRKAAVMAVDDGESVVRDKHMDEALRELVISGGVLQRNLLGVRESVE